MRAVIQRVNRASVSVDGTTVGTCGCGLLALVAAHRDDNEQNVRKMAARISRLRVFSDSEGKMNLALADVGGSVLLVSNFTVYGETSKNRRPSFLESAPYETGRVLFDALVDALRGLGIKTVTGVFGAMMQVDLVNDGPVTLILDT